MATRRLGIIPAAGSANRFGGVIKELLPVAKDMAVIDYTIQAMKQGGANAIVVVTSGRKIGPLSEHRPSLLYTLQVEARDIWGAILAGMRYEADEYLFAMPDTVVPYDAFDRNMTADFELGTFWTDQPERFGMIRHDGIHNKRPGEAGAAWGVLMWRKKVRDYWIEYDHDIQNYTNAFNMAMSIYSWKAYELSGYNDISNFEEYKWIIANG